MKENNYGRFLLKMRRAASEPSISPEFLILTATVSVSVSSISGESVTGSPYSNVVYANPNPKGKRTGIEAVS